MENINSIILASFKRWKVLVVCILLGGVLLGTEKALTTEAVEIQTENVQIESLMAVENQDKHNLYEIDQGMKYEKVLSTYAFVSRFINETKDKIDYSKLNYNWDNLTEIEKIKWIQSVFLVRNFDDGAIQSVVLLKANVAKDITYIKNNEKIILDTVYQQYKEEISRLKPEYSLRIVNSYGVYPEIQNISKNDIIIKYVGLGLLLGFIVGITINSINVVRSKNG